MTYDVRNQRQEKAFADRAYNTGANQSSHVQFGNYAGRSVTVQSVPPVRSTFEPQRPAGTTRYPQTSSSSSCASPVFSNSSFMPRTETVYVESPVTDTVFVSAPVTTRHRTHWVASSTFKNPLSNFFAGALIGTLIGCVVSILLFPPFVVVLAPAGFFIGGFLASIDAAVKAN